MKSKKKFLGVLVSNANYRTVERVAKINHRSKTYVAEKFLEAGINTLNSFVVTLGINTRRERSTLARK